jgi:hypothetical protein
MSVRRNLAFGVITLFLVLFGVELVLNALTIVGFLPVNDPLTPWFYRSTNPADHVLDANGSPIPVNGVVTYNAPGVPQNPVYYDGQGYRPEDPSRFKSRRPKIGFFGDSYTQGLPKACRFRLKAPSPSCCKMALKNWDCSLTSSISRSPELAPITSTCVISPSQETSIWMWRCWAFCRRTTC